MVAQKEYEKDLGRMEKKSAMNRTKEVLFARTPPDVHPM